MKRKVLFATMMCCLFCSVQGQKVMDTFYRATFGMTEAQVKDNLTAAERPYEQKKSGNIYLKDADVAGTTYATVCFMFSPVDGTFYRLIGSNSYASKENAAREYDAMLSDFRERYPRLQVLRKPNHAERMFTYMDDDNAFYVGLFKGKDGEGKTAYYVNINIWDKYRNSQISDTAN